VVKLADLGMTKFMLRSTAGTFAGTPAYMSPEMPKSENEYGKYSNKSDIWLGDLSYYSLTRRLKYD